MYDVSPAGPGTPGLMDTQADVLFSVPSVPVAARPEAARPEGQKVDLSVQGLPTTMVPRYVDVEPCGEPYGRWQLEEGLGRCYRLSADRLITYPAYCAPDIPLQPWNRVFTGAGTGRY